MLVGQTMPDQTMFGVTSTKQLLLGVACFGFRSAIASATHPSCMGQITLAGEQVGEQSPAGWQR